MVGRVQIEVVFLYFLYLECFLLFFGLGFILLRAWESNYCSSFEAYLPY
jgi:hypothetical protein